MDALAFDMASAPDPRASIRPQLLHEELSEVRSQIQALSSQYTDEHPRIAELKERERILNGWLESAPGGIQNPALDQGSLSFDDNAAGAARESYEDLKKKVDYLNIALESDKGQQTSAFAVLEAPVYPRDPLWPNKALFALWGVAGGLFGTLFLAAVRNYFDRSVLHADDLADRLGVPLLGDLPVLPRADRKLAHP
jgi:hypothetical protein